MVGVSVRHDQAAVRADDTLAPSSTPTTGIRLGARGPSAARPKPSQWPAHTADSIPESGVRRVPLAHIAERAAFDELWVPPPHRSLPPPRKHRLRPHRELPLGALLPGVIHRSGEVDPEPAAEQLIPLCALEAPMVVLSNDRLLASVAPPPLEPIPMRLRQRVEGWVRQLAAWPATVHAAVFGRSRSLEDR
jgi:hypothetical protein